jgi:hypothetical protein
MHCATLVYPCDNKRLLGGLKSILEAFPVASDNATSTAQRHSATNCHHKPQLGTGHTLGQHWAQLGSCHQPYGLSYIALVCRLKKVHILILTTIQF